MALTQRQIALLGVAGGIGLIVPLVALWPGASMVADTPPTSNRPVVVGQVPEVAVAYTRPLFAPAKSAATAPVDAPALLGIAGRLNRDAVALVRLSDGGSRSLSVGESVDGWRLESLAIDAAFFTRGRERVRVAMQDEPAPE